MGNVTAIRSLDMTPSQLALIKRTVAADCNDDEFSLFIEVSRRVGLDPFRKQICAIVYQKDKPDKRKMSIITEIAGYRAIADRSKLYRPDENEPEIFYNDDMKDPKTNPLGIDRAVVTVHKFGPDGVWYPVKGFAYWAELAPIVERWADGGATGRRTPTGEYYIKEGSHWLKSPRNQIAKCAEANALRKGWPEETAGVYVAEEMDRATADDLTASERAEKAAVDLRLKLTAGRDTMMFMWAPGEPLEPVPIGELADRCISFLHDAKDAPTVTAWAETNRAPLREFWARAKSDALGVKQFMERRLAELKALATPETERQPT